MNCPICQKAGLANEVTHCPQCNSDLTSFTLLEALEIKLNASRKTNWLNILGLLAIGSLLTYTIFYFFSSKELIRHDNTKLSLNSTNTIDSIKLYRTRLVLAEKEVDSLKQIKSFNSIEYKVRQGETLSLIALIFYNDINRAEEIARLNNLNNPNLIKVNQVLKIQIMQ